jgi:enamidase
MRAPLLCLALTLGVHAAVSAQRPRLANGVRQYVAIDTAVVALTHVRVIDGTGAPARPDQTLVIANGRISALGDAGRTPVPAGALVIDATGKSVIPGLVMVHEHLFYPTGPGAYGNVAESFTRLYLAGGVTAMRTGGNLNGLGEIGIAQSIAAGEKPGPWIDATAPYLDGPGLPLDQVRALRDAEDARRQVDYWADAGATSYKAYMYVMRAMLGAAIDQAHKRGHKVTGHLCSVTYREAAGLGIDDLEHGFFASTDFVQGKQPDVCPAGPVVDTTIAGLDPSSPDVQSLFAELIRRRVAVTSTLTVFETFTPGRPIPPGLQVLEPLLAQAFTQRYAATQRNADELDAELFRKGMALELAFVRAGGTLVAGTDPTGGGGVIPGYSNQRQVELLVEAGFTPLEAIGIATLNGATYLGIADRTGSVAVGKQADLVLISGDPSTRIGDIRNVQTVFKQGIGYDPAKLIASVSGMVGLF